MHYRVGVGVGVGGGLKWALHWQTPSWQMKGEQKKNIGWGENGSAVVPVGLVAQRKWPECQSITMHNLTERYNHEEW
jgi:hypothetical protein